MQRSSAITIAPLIVSGSSIEIAPLKVVEPLIVVEEGAPPGFEDLEEPQKGLIDVYYGGEFLRTVPSVFTGESITFLQPEVFLDKIPYLLDPQRVLTLLSGELTAHTHLICRKRGEKECGELPADQTGVIFQIGTHRADIFVSEELLSKKRAKDKYLLPSSADLSFVVPFSIVVSNSSNDNSIFSVNGESLISKGNTHLQSRWNYSENVGFLAQDLSLRRDKNGKEAQLGIFDTRGFGSGFMTGHSIAGSRYASTTRTRTDRSIAGGSMLSVLLNSRSRVAIVKNGRVLSSNMYDSGNQILDTSLLPDGSYDVVIKIEDSSGQVREVTRYFSKSQALPPEDQPLYFIDGGNMLWDDERMLPNSSDHWLLEGGYMTRLRGNLALHGTTAVTEDQSVVEFGSVYLSSICKLNTVALVTSTSDYGLSFSAQTFFDSFSLFASAVIVDIHSPLTDNSVQSDEYRLINTDREEYSFRLTLPFFDSRLDLSYNLRKSSEGKYRSYEEDMSALINYPLINMRQHRLNLISHLYHYEVHEDDAFIGLEYSFVLPKWRHDFEYGARRSAMGDHGRMTTTPMRIRSTWRDSQRTGEQTEVAAFLDNGVEENATMLGAHVDYGFRGGRFRFSADHQIHDDPARDNFNRYSLNFNSHIAGDTDGVAWGGARRERSAAIINVSSEEDSHEYFEIFVNNQQRGYAYINKSTLLSLLAYENYDIAIYPPAGTNYNYLTIRKKITVYPGNTKSFDWQVVKIHTVFGQVVDSSGEPLRNASIEESDLYEGSDEYGIFQADIAGNVKMLTFAQSDKRCTVQLPTYDKTKFIAALGKLMCVKKADSGEWKE